MKTELKQSESNHTRKSKLLYYVNVRVDDFSETMATKAILVLSESESEGEDAASTLGVRE